MKKFICKTAFFIFPIVLLVLPIILTLKISRENYTSINQIILNEQKGLIGYIYNEQNYNYIKWTTIVKRKRHSVIALGSSRVLQFREEMFDAPFYNAGFTISSVSDYKPFLQSLPKTKLPNVLIIGLDQWMFNSAWPDQSSSKEQSYWKNSFHFIPSLTILKLCLKDLFNGKYSFKDLINKSTEKEKNLKIGINAIFNDTGLRNDGSMLYGSQIKKLLQQDSTASDFEFKDTFSRIEKGDRRFQYGSVISTNFNDQLDELLEFCESNQIYVIAFLPPFANEVQSKIKENGNYTYMNEATEVARVHLKKYNFEFWDLSDLNLYGSNDKEVIDGFHGGELTYQKMLIYMLEHNSELLEYTDSNRLKTDLQNQRNRYAVYYD